MEKTLRGDGRGKGAGCPALSGEVPARTLSVDTAGFELNLRSRRFSKLPSS
jgi:hypothetical protein